METNKEVVSILNDLVQINNDRIKGYEKAIDDSKRDPVYISTFEKMIAQSEGYRDDLIKAIRQMGGNPDIDATTNSGKVYRVWMDVKATFTGHTDQSVLELCEFGEDAAKKAYEEAMKENMGLHSEIRSLISSQQSGLRQSHDLIKAERDRKKAQA